MTHGRLLVTNQTEYLTGGDSRCSRVISDAVVHPFFVYVVPSRTRTVPFARVWIAAPVIPFVGTSNVQQSFFPFAFTFRLTIPCSPMPARRAASCGCMPARAAGAKTAKPTTAEVD